MEYPPTPHFGLNFLLSSKVYSDMCPYLAALEYACVITIKWAWLRLQTVHNHFLVLKHSIRLPRLSSTAVWPAIFLSYIDYLKYIPQNQLLTSMWHCEVSA